MVGTRDSFHEVRFPTYVTPTDCAARTIRRWRMARGSELSPTQAALYQHRELARYLQRARCRCRLAGKITQSREAKAVRRQIAETALRVNQRCSVLCVGMGGGPYRRQQGLPPYRWTACVENVVNSARGMAAGRAGTLANPIRTSCSCNGTVAAFR